MPKRKRNRRINASSTKAERINFAAPVDVQAAAADGKRPTFTIQAYNGGPMRTGFSYHPVVIDLSGLKASRDKLPILFGHDDSRPVGLADKVTIDANGVTLSGKITGDDGDAKTIIEHAKNGFEWQASIGASVERREFLDAGKTAEVNGREVTGPLIIARASTLVETSFVTIGADQTTSAKVAAKRTGESDMKFNEWLEAKGFDPENLNDQSREFLKAQYDAEQEPKPKKKASTTTDDQSVQASATPARSGGTITRDLDEIRAQNARISEIKAMVLDYARKYPSQIDTIEAAANRAIEEDSRPQDLELELLRACRGTPIDNSIGNGGNRAKGLDDKVIEAAMCLAGGLANIEKHFSEQTLEAAHKQHRHGLGLEEVLVLAARQNGLNTLSAKDLDPTLRAAFRTTDIRAGFSTISLPTIFSNVANKFLLQGFNAVESGWRSIARVRPVRDFKQITNVRRIGQTLFEKVGPDGELKHGTMGEEVFTNKAHTYGGMYGITREHIINDDLGALTSTPADIGRDGAIRLNKEFWGTFLDNASFFSVGNDNLLSGSGSALGLNALTAAELAFFNMKDGNGNPLGLMPRTLLVPNALNVPASKLMNDTEIRDTTASTKYTTGNPHAGKFQVVRSSYLSDATLSGSSAKAWYLLADPADLPVIEVVFLNGVEQPTVEQAEANFNTLGIQMRGYFDFGVALQDPRAGIKNAGE